MMNTNVCVTIIEPWEFCEDNGGSSRFYAEILDREEDFFLIEANQPVIHRSNTQIISATKFLSHLRNAPSEIQSESAKSLVCNMVPVSDTTDSLDKAKQEAEKWRGRGLIGMITEEK